MRVRRLGARAPLVRQIRLGAIAFVTASCAAAARIACGGPAGGDIIVGAIGPPVSYSAVDGVAAYAFATTACNMGDEPLSWFITGPDEALHPVLVQNLYRLHDGRFEQIGQSWARHGVCALQGSFCGTCEPLTLCDFLGVGCSSPDTAVFNGQQAGLGPRSQVNPFTGDFPYPFTAPPPATSIDRRLQVALSDLDPALNPGAAYWVEARFVHPDDALAGNAANNASYRSVVVGPFTGETFALSVAGSTVPELPALAAWQAADGDVSITAVDVPGDGRVLVAAKVTDLGGGLFGYEYAIANGSSARAVASIVVPLPADASVTEPGFHAVPSHSGEPFANDAWSHEVTASAASWSCVPYDVDPNANALRWGTLYNVRFIANSAPIAGEVTLGLFSPGSPDSVMASAPVPGPRPSLYRVYVSNGSGGGLWESPSTWRDYPSMLPVTDVPGADRHMDIVRIVSGDVVTQSSALPYTLGYYLLDEDASHDFAEGTDLKALVVEAYGRWTPPPQPEVESELHGVLTVWNAARLTYQFADVEFDRRFDERNYCPLIDAAVEPFEDLKPCEIPEYDGEFEPPTGFDDTSTHRALTEIAIDSAACTLHERLKKEYKFPKGLEEPIKSGAHSVLPGTLTQSVKKWVIDGAEWEDAVAGRISVRVLRHFLSPITSVGFDPPGPIGAYNAAPVWAQADADNSWDHAELRKYLRKALTDRKKVDREDAWGYVFRSLGQILHLLEDMSSVAHTRNDEHPVFAPFEDYCKKWYGTPAQITKYIRSVTKVGDEVPRYRFKEPVPDHKRFRHFWDTDQWTGQFGFNRFDKTPGLAEFVNFNYFSEDSVFERLANWTPRPTVGDTDLLAAVFGAAVPADWKINKVNTRVANADVPGTWKPVRKAGGGLGNQIIKRVCVARNAGLGTKSFYFFGSAPTLIEVTTVNAGAYDEHAEVLLPKAIAYAAGLANYIFRGRVDVEATVNPGTVRLKITNRSGATLKEGTWSIYQDDAEGKRSRLENDFADTYPGSLDDRASFVGKFKPIGQGGRYTLVFDGALGEDDTGGGNVVFGKVFN